MGREERGSKGAKRPKGRGEGQEEAGTGAEDYAGRKSRRPVA